MIRLDLDFSGLSKELDKMDPGLRFGFLRIWMNWIRIFSLDFSKDWIRTFFRIWIRFDRDTKMFKFAALSFLIRLLVLFLRRLVTFAGFSFFVRSWSWILACSLRSDTN